MSHFSKPVVTVSVGATAIKAQLARTAAEQDQGLSGVQSLEKGSGMLFVFTDDGGHPMWMKDMSFNLDIIWLNNAKTVVYVKRDLAPETYPTTYASPTASRYVLEVPAGTAAESEIMIGKVASFDVPN